MISSGTYPAGGRLPPERELAEQFSVSRPTIREAIIALEAKGLGADKEWFRGVRALTKRWRQSRNRPGSNARWKRI